MKNLRYFAASIFGCLAIPFGFATCFLLLTAALIAGETIEDTLDRYVGKEEE